MINITKLSELHDSEYSCNLFLINECYKCEKEFLSGAPGLEAHQ